MRVSYERRGRGGPLLLLMGIGATRHWWSPAFLDRLACGRELILCEHRGVAGGDEVTEPFSIAELAADAAELLGDLGIGRTDVFGVSLGGLVAQELTIAQPGLVRRLILGCTSAFPPGRPLVKMLTALLQTGDADRFYASFMPSFVSDRFLADEASRGLLREVVAQHRVPLALVALQLQAAMGHDASTSLPLVCTPTLVIHGTEDRVVPYASASRLVERIPDARLETLEEVGHAFFWEAPERAADTICSFLDGSP